VTELIEFILRREREKDDIISNPSRSNP
jgi:hypothetical protein